MSEGTNLVKSKMENLSDIKALLDKGVKAYETDIVQFLRDLVAIPSESCQEEMVIKRIAQEMEKLGYDSVKIDDMGNVIGRIGNGKRIIAIDSHIDTVGVGNLNQWKWDPYKGKLEDGKIYGRGVLDQKAGIAGSTYAGRLIKDYNLTSDYTLYVVGSVQEEDCDGLCWQHIIKNEKLRPECVVITEPTNLNIYRGHRGRMEIGVTTVGKAAHASNPDNGDNAVYSMSRIVAEIEKLNEELTYDEFLGKGTVAVTNIKCKSPSLCAVPDECYIHLDRRLTAGENRESALSEVRHAIEEAGVEAKVEVLTYSKPSYKGYVNTTDCYFPTWTLSEDHPLLSSSVNTYETLFEKSPKVDKWTFSTNGVAIMGIYGIPAVGFGAGDERYAHSVDEFVFVDDVLDATRWYALFPKVYSEIMEELEKNAN